MAWLFRSWVDGLGRDAVKAWLDGLPPEVQAAILVQIQYMASTSQKQWEEADEYKRLTDGLEDIEEIRIVFKIKARKKTSARDVHYRILGFTNNSRTEFTMLCGFEKIKGDEDYEENGPIALDRRHDVMTNRRKFSRPTDWMKDDE